jgi:hypothetical protein
MVIPFSCHCTAQVNSFHNMQPTFPISLIYIIIARHTRARKFNQLTVGIYYTINAECEAFPKTAVKVVRGSPGSTLKNMPLSVPCVEDESISSRKRPNTRFAAKQSGICFVVDLVGDSLTNPQRNNITREDQTSKKLEPR